MTTGRPSINLFYVLQV